MNFFKFTLLSIVSLGTTSYTHSMDTATVITHAALALQVAHPEVEHTQDAPKHTKSSNARKKQWSKSPRQKQTRQWKQNNQPRQNH